MEKLDLVKMPVKKVILLLSIPIMLTSFVQMAYNLTDLIYIGRLGGESIAAVGTAGSLLWFFDSFFLVCRIGAQVHTAYSIGQGDKEKAKDYIRTSFIMTIIIWIVIMIFCLIFGDFIIGFFNLKDKYTFDASKKYLLITIIFGIFNLLNIAYGALLTAIGNSKDALIISCVGLVFNVILNPIFIFKLNMGVSGAAIATVIAQIIVFGCFIYFTRKEELFVNIYSEIFKYKIDLSNIKDILKIGIPTGVQNLVFAFVGMYIARMVAEFSVVAIAIQKVGSQIESLSWLVGESFAGATASFVSQNYGAKEYKRIKEGSNFSMIFMCIWGLFTSILLITQPEMLFKIFTKDEFVIKSGIYYLIILGFSQIPMCIEITASGIFSGLSNTFPPSIVSGIFNIMRIPLAYLLIVKYGLNGIWLAISISSILKGTVLFIWLKIYEKKIYV